MLLAGGSIILVFGAVSLFGALELDSPEDSDPPSFGSQVGGSAEIVDSPPATLPPTLEESLPGLSDRLTLAALTREGFVTLLWDPSFRIPREYPLSIDVSGDASSAFAAFDSGGRTLAVGRDLPDGYSVYLGEPTDLGSDPDLVANSPIIWHATEVGALAWIADDADGVPALHTGVANPLSGDLMKQDLVTLVDESSRIVRWDSNGFILDDGTEVHSLNPDGRVLWSRQGSAISATPSLVVTTTSSAESDQPRWSILERATGDPSDVTIADSRGNLDVVASMDLDIVAAITRSDARSSITVSGPDLVAKRIVQVDDDVTAIGFSPGNAYIVFERNGTNDLVFVNWRTGATHALEIPDIYEILAMDLG